MADGVDVGSGRNRHDLALPEQDLEGHRQVLRQLHQDRLNLDTGRCSAGDKYDQVSVQVSASCHPACRC